MVTFLIILLTIIAVCVASKKKKRDTQEDFNARVQYPNFTVKAKPMSTMSKVVNLAVNKSQLLDIISYDKGNVYILMQDGKELIGELSKLFVEFSKSGGLIGYKVQSSTTKVQFYHTTNISSEEWELINGLLCLAGTTRGEYVFSKSYKNTNTALKAYKIISKL